MDSIVTTLRTTLGRLSAAGSLGVVFALPNSGMAQQLSELGKLIFEPVPLSFAQDSPIDLNRSAAAADGQALADSVSEHLAAIESLRAADAPLAALVERLGLLAVAYQDLDRHEQAIETLEEAISATIDEGGRRNLEQIPLHEQKIPSYLALEDIRGVDDTEELIYSLYERHFGPGDRQMYYATINYADWLTTAYYQENFSAGNRMLARQRGVVPGVQRCIRLPDSPAVFGEPAGCLTNPIFTGEIKDVPTRDINDVRLRKIDRLYANYQDALLKAGNVQLDIIMDMAKRIARLAFATKQEMDFERGNYTFDPNYEGSRAQAVRNSPARMEESYDSGVAALKYAIDVPGSVADWRPEALAAALLDMGDWHLAYGKAAAAEAAYAEAYEVLLDAGFSPANIDRGLAADLPIRIPVFATHLYTRRSTGTSPSAELDFKGYVDVSYTVDSLGNAHDVEFLGGSSEAGSDIERLLERQFRSAKFRPVLQGGELFDSGRIEARYYYAY